MYIIYSRSYNYLKTRCGYGKDVKIHNYAESIYTRTLMTEFVKIYNYSNNNNIH